MTTLPIFYINLDTRPDRKAFMEDQFARIGVHATRVPAVTAEQASGMRNGMMFPAKRSNAEVACNLSHRKVWEIAASLDAPAVIVLEDDAVIADGFLAFLEWQRYFPMAPAVVKLETFLRPVRTGTHRTAISTDCDIRWLLSAHAGAAAYVISGEAARTSLDDERSAVLLVDEFLFGTRGRFLHRGEVAQAIPSPCVQAYKLKSIGYRGIGESDLRPERDVQSIASGPHRVSLRQRIDRALVVAGWITRDPRVLLRTRKTIAFSGSNISS